MRAKEVNVVVIAQRNIRYEDEILCLFPLINTLIANVPNLKS